MRAGTGYDVHRLTEGRKLILCGVEIPYEKGLLGHSDADVALHAIMDALLGAAAMKDIGYHFPDTDPAYEGASSMELLRKVGEMLDEGMYIISNIDCTIICQKPKLRPYLDRMVRNVADVLGLTEDQVNIKATTEEGLGFTGRGEGIAAQAVCMLEKAMDQLPSDRAYSASADSSGGCAACPMRTLAKTEADAHQAG
ncbi:MAG: 2-C-methyl-D-erythritol 2,4-cyclodiphosphate synthase [Bilifractor sp.]